MSGILFVNGNLYGHFNPTIPLVKELVSKGEEVWYYSSDIFKERIEAAGAHFISTGDFLEEFYKSYRPVGNHPFYTLMEYTIKYNKVILPDIINKISRHQFEAVIYDSILGAGYFLKELLKLPSVCSNSSFAINRLPIPEQMLEKGFHTQLDEYFRIVTEVCSTWNVKEPSILEMFSGKGDLNLVYTSKEFQVDGGSFDDSYIFTGPSISERQENVEFPLEMLTGKNIIYISLGTINTEFNDFYKLCMEAFQDSDFLIVMSVGKKCNIKELGEIPANFLVRNYVPQLEILKRASVFICHGGFNSISEALYFEVPVIAIPMKNDQFMTGAQIRKTGTGITLDMKGINKEILQEAAGNIVRNKDYYKNCCKISETFKKASGYGYAAERIRSMIKEEDGSENCNNV